MPTPLTFFLHRLPTPIGESLLITHPEGHLRALDWPEYEPRMHRLLRLHYGAAAVHLTPSPTPTALKHSLNQYFTGDPTALTHIPVKTAGTLFQRQVWTALQQIPSGSTITYAQLAARIGNPTAVRGVGLANGQNPIGIVIPCHRVVGSNGSLTGYGGGLERKSWLLQHEAQHESRREAQAAPAQAAHPTLF